MGIIDWLLGLLLTIRIKVIYRKESQDWHVTVKQGIWGWEHTAITPTCDEAITWAKQVTDDLMDD